MTCRHDLEACPFCAASAEVHSLRARVAAAEAERDKCSRSWLEASRRGLQPDAAVEDCRARIADLELQLSGRPLTIDMQRVIAERDAALSRCAALEAERDKAYQSAERWRRRYNECAVSDERDAALERCAILEQQALADAAQLQVMREALVAVRSQFGTTPYEQSPRTVIDDALAPDAGSALLDELRLLRDVAEAARDMSSNHNDDTYRCACSCCDLGRALAALDSKVKP